MNNSPTPAEVFSSDFGQASSSAAGPGRVNQPVKTWPKNGGSGKSELDAILKRLAERVQYITGATGAAVGLLEGTDMVCRATSGTTAPDLGVHLETWKGLSGECIRTGDSLRCDNVEMDKRVEVESCRRMGVQSLIVTPVRRNNVVVGIFELFSSQPYAFQDRDVATLQRTAELLKKELETRPVVVDAAYVRLPVILQKAPDEPQEGYDQHAQEVPDESLVSPSELVVQLGDDARVEAANEGPGESVPLSPCRNCGAAMPSDRLLCSACGSLQADPDSLVIPLPEEVEPPKCLGSEPESKFHVRLPKYSIGAILAMLALFVAFVPVHTNQPASAEATSSAAPQEQPASLPALPTPAQSTSENQSAVTSPVAPSPAATNPAANTNAWLVAPSTPTQQTAVPQSASPQTNPGSQQLTSTPPQQASSRAPAMVVQSSASNTRMNQAGWTQSTTVATEQQGSEVVPQMIPIGPIAGTPHANPEALAPPPAVQPQYGSAEGTANQSKQPWLFARIGNAIDSFQQMFEPAPDPGPTTEQLGEPGVVVWVDLATGLYYCPGASSYGKTEKGKFLTQKEAHAEYFNSAIRIGCK